MVFLRCKRHDRVIEQCNFLSQGLKAIKEGDEASNEISGKLAEVCLYDLTTLIVLSPIDIYRLPSVCRRYTIDRRFDIHGDRAGKHRVEAGTQTKESSTKVSSLRKEYLNMILLINTMYNSTIRIYFIIH